MVPHQVLSGILPISRVSAVPACIHFAAQLLPLERIYNLVHPSVRLPPVEDKRTWRDGQKLEERTKDLEKTTWTAMDILIAYADAKGWVTAKAGRPDIHRAGNASTFATCLSSPPMVDAKLYFLLSPTVTS